MSINLKQNFEEPVALIGHGGFCEELASSIRKRKVYSMGKVRLCFLDLKTVTKRLASALLIGAAMFLSSCGGGGGSSGATAPPSNNWDSMVWDQGNWG